MKLARQFLLHQYFYRSWHVVSGLHVFLISGKFVEMLYCFYQSYYLIRVSWDRLLYLFKQPNRFLHGLSPLIRQTELVKFCNMVLSKVGYNEMK